MLPKDLVTVQQVLPPVEPQEGNEHSGEELLSLQLSLGDRYKIRDYLAGGGMGSVYTAEDMGLRRLVAIKVIHLPSGAEARGVHQRRFLHEMTALGSIRHPNVVTVYGQGGDGTKQRPLHLIMEHLGGLTLTNYIHHRGTVKTSFPLKDGKESSQGALLLDQAVRLIRPIAEGLRAMHAGGMLHRDLKSDNVIIDINEATGTERPVLIDFGLVKVAPIPDDDRTIIDLPKTEAGMVFGTVQYMPPEQLRGKVFKHTDYFVDTYALTCIFYEMLAGFVPYANILERELDHDQASLDQNVMAWMSVHARGLAFLPIRQLRPELPAWLDRFFAKGLERESSERFQTANDFLQALETEVLAESIRQQQLIDTQRRQEEVRQRRTAFLGYFKGMAAGVVLLGLALLVVRLAQYHCSEAVPRLISTRAQLVDAATHHSMMPPSQEGDGSTSVTEDVVASDVVAHDAGAILLADADGRSDAATVTDVGQRRRRRPPVRRCGDINPLTGTIIPCFH